MFEANECRSEASIQYGPLSASIAVVSLLPWIPFFFLSCQGEASAANCRDE
jgi:hypothetical protein